MASHAPWKGVPDVGHPNWGLAGTGIKSTSIPASLSCALFIQHFSLSRLQSSGFHSKSASQAFLNHHCHFPTAQKGPPFRSSLGKKSARPGHGPAPFNSARVTSYCWPLSASHLCSHLSPTCINWFQHIPSPWYTLMADLVCLPNYTTYKWVGTAPAGCFGTVCCTEPILLPSKVPSTQSMSLPQLSVAPALSDGQPTTSACSSLMTPTESAQ